VYETAFYLSTTDHDRGSFSFQKQVTWSIKNALNNQVSFERRSNL